MSYLIWYVIYDIIFTPLAGIVIEFIIRTMIIVCCHCQRQAQTSLVAMVTSHWLSWLRLPWLHQYNILNNFHLISYSRVLAANSLLSQNSHNLSFSKTLTLIHLLSLLPLTLMNTAIRYVTYEYRYLRCYGNLQLID